MICGLGRSEVFIGIIFLIVIYYLFCFIIVIHT